MAVPPHDELCNGAHSGVAEIHGAVADDLHLDLWDIFTTTASAYPDRDAIVSLWQPETSVGESHDSGSYLRWKYKNLLEKATCIAHSLTKLRRQPGMRLAVILWNSAEWGLFFWVAAKIGMTFVPIDPRDQDEAQAVLLSLNPEVVVVQGQEGATVVESVLGKLSNLQVRIQCSDAVTEGWVSLSQLGSPISLMDHGLVEKPVNTQRPNMALVVFTSGTTGKPKGCPHSSQALIAQTSDYDPHPDPELVDRWLVHTPVSHIFAVNNALRGWRFGGAVIFPSKSFDVDATLRALVQEQVTIMSATPTLVKALLSHPNFPALEKLNVSLVTIGGTKIEREDIRLCRDGLGAANAIQAYGMSEGAPLISWKRDDELLMDGYHPGVGKVLPGAAIRICAPKTQRVLSRNQTGELHIGGPSVIKGYLNDADAGAFYEDSNGRWLITGDQALVDDDSVLHIFGRYKDIIIRGGENICPAKIEAALAKIPDIQAYVIGVEDDLAQEVPVVIVSELSDNIARSVIYEQVRQLGSKYSLAGVYTLEELGFRSVPMTSLGKVKKEKLRQAVEKLRRKAQGRGTQMQKPSSDASTELCEELLEIWKDLIGSRPSTTDRVAHMADSITLLRYCDAVFRTTGKQLYLQDLAVHDMVETQAQLLMTRASQCTSQSSNAWMNSSSKLLGSSQQLPSRERALPAGNADTTLVSMPENSRCQLQHPMEAKAKTWHLAEQKLIDMGLSISTAEDILPIRGSLQRMVRGQRPHSYHVRMVFQVGNAGNQQIRRGIEKALQSRPMLRTVLFDADDGDPHHIVLKLSHQLLEAVITHVTVGTEDEARACYQHDSADMHSSPHMFRAEIIEVTGAGRRFLSLTYSHSVMDALSLLPWHQELDRLIHDLDANTIASTPFSLFSDLFMRYQDSLPAQEAVAFHVRRLRGISRFKRALWPVQHAPGWMISSDKASTDAAKRDVVRAKIWNGEWQSKAELFRNPRLGRVVQMASLARLNEEYGIDPSLFARCAVIIFNTLQTGCSHAIFNSWESGRSWPFVPEWVGNLLPPAMSIDGPTVEWMLNMSEVFSDESITDFLQRIRVERAEASHHEHVPWDKVVRGLRDEGEVAVDASFRQSFVWDMTLGLKASQSFQQDFRSLQPVARLDWADCGIFWNAFMLDRDNLYFTSSWDTAQMNDVEVNGHCDQLAEVMRKMAKEENWSKTVGQVFRE